MIRTVVALARKDLRITRVFWAPMAFSYAVFLLLVMENLWAYLATGTGLAFVLAATAAAIDDRYQTGPLFAALPGTRRGQVAGRYAAWGTVSAAALVLFLGETALLFSVFGARSHRLIEIFSLKGSAAFLAGTWLASLIFLPLQFRFGFWPGLGWFAGAGSVLSVVALSALARLAPAGARPGGPASELPGVLGSTGRGLRALVWLIDRHMGRPEVVAATAALLALLTWLSYRLSARFHGKRDL